MNLRRAWLAAVLLLLPATGYAASREIQELQRDVAQLQADLRTLQQSQNEKLAALTELVRQALDAANRANTTTAVLENNIRQTLREQGKSVVEPVAGVGAKVDQMTQEFQAMRENVADIGRRIGNLELKVTDLSNAVKTMQAPAPPPPGTSAAPPPAASAPPLPAETLFMNARRDKLGGKAELALQEFQDYLKYYGNTDAAAEAQYYIGEIHFSQGDFDTALKEFDTVLERYQDNPKTADALWMKGLALVKVGRKTDASKEFRELITRFPGTDLSKKACAQLTGMGLRCPASRAASSRPARKKK